MGLAHVCADELDVASDCVVAVLHGLWERHELDQSGSPVGKPASVIWCTLHHLGEGVHRGRPVTILELLLTQFAGLLSLRGVNVGLFLGLDLGLFCVAELRQGVRSAMLSERLVVVLDGLREITLLLVGGTNTGE